MTQEVLNKEWLKQRLEKIQKDKEENSKFLTLKNGENFIEIDTSVLPVEDNAGKFGLRYIYTTTLKQHNKKDPLLLSVSPTLDALITKALFKEINPFIVVKVGELKDTRYAIKELDES